MGAEEGVWSSVLPRAPPALADFGVAPVLLSQLVPSSSS